MKLPEMGMNNPPKTPDNNLRVKAALKSGQAEKKGYDWAYFADNEHLLEDAEIMAIVAKQYPHVLGHLQRLNRDKNFVIHWLGQVDPNEVVNVYHNARKNALRISLSKEEFDLIINRK